MAIKLTSKPNTNPANADYPYGDIRDNSGINDGTPVNRMVYADFHQFFEKLMAESGIEHNGSPDNATNGFQLFDALMALNGGLLTRIYQIGGWNMNADLTKTVVLGLPGGNVIGQSMIRSVDIVIIDNEGDYRPYLSNSFNFGANANVGYITNSSGVVMQHQSDANFATSSNYSGTASNRGFVTVRYTI